MIDRRSGVVFRNQVAGIGAFTFKAYNNESDAQVIHPWVNMEYAKFWMLNNSTLADVKAEYRKIMAPTGTSVYLGFLNETPVFLTEIYDPSKEEIAEHVTLKPGDLGMHVLVGPSEVRIPGFTRGVFASVMKCVFDLHGAERVIVEPDVTNLKIQKLNNEAGFRVLKPRVALSSKTARIECCTRAEFEHSGLMRSLS